jgi:DNA-binding MarR family transcriptional regulator
VILSQSTGIIIPETNKAVRTRPGYGLSGDEPLWTLLDSTRFAVTRLRELELAEFGLTIERSAILKILASRGGSTTAGTLEYLTMRQPHTISTLINRMTKMGLISKKRMGTEKRHTFSLTTKGNTLLDEITETSLEVVFSCLSVEENEELIRILRVLQKRSRTLLRVPFMEYIFRDDTSAGLEGHTRWRGPLTETAWTLLDRTRFVVARLRELELSQFGLTIEQSAILKMLFSGAGSASTKLLEEITMRQHHSISTLINRMIAMRLVTKIRHKGEKRYTILITKEGEELLRTLTNISVEMCFSSLTEEEKEKLKVFLRRVEDKARNMLGSPLNRDILPAG